MGKSTLSREWATFLMAMDGRNRMKPCQKELKWQMLNLEHWNNSLLNLNRVNYINYKLYCYILQNHFFFVTFHKN